MNNVLDQVEKTLEAETTATESSYRKLVKRLALNEDVSKDEATATLKTSGRKSSELRADIDCEQRCNALREIIKSKQARLARQQKAEAAKVDYHKRQQQSFKAFHDEGQKVHLELNQARAAFGEIGRAAAELEELTGEVVELPVAEPEPVGESQTQTSGRKSKRA